MDGRLGPAALFVLLAGALMPAQGQPDFSGRWILEWSSDPGPDTPRALFVRQPVVRTNVRGEPVTPFYLDIAIDREYESGTRSEQHRIGIVGGVVPGARADGRAKGGTYLRHATRWEAHALVFESGSYSGRSPETGRWDERREEWTLGTDGRLRVVITIRPADDGSRTITALFRRQRS